MSASPRFKVYRDGEYVAAVKYPEDAGMLLAGGNGEIRDGHRRVVYRAIDATGDSYDDVAAEVWAKVEPGTYEGATR